MTVNDNNTATSVQQIRSVCINLFQIVVLLFITIITSYSHIFCFNYEFHTEPSLTKNAAVYQINWVENNEEKTL